MVIDNYFSVILLMGAILSILLSMYLLFYPSKFYANKVLGALAFSWGITVFGYMIYSTDFFQRYPHLFGFLDTFTLCFFPLTYVYIRTYLYTDARQFNKYWMHFIPVVLYLIGFMPFLVLDAKSKVEIIVGSKPFWMQLVEMVFNMVIIVQGIFYTILSLRKLYHFEYFREARLTRYQMASIKWLRVFLIVNILLWTIGTAGALFEIFWIKIQFDLFSLFYLGLTLLTLVLIGFTIQRPEFFSEEEDIAKVMTSKKLNRISEALSEEMVPLDESKLLVNYIEDSKTYLKPDLKIKDLAHATGLTIKRISEILNNDLKKSFSDLVNEYRMQTAIRLIEEGFHKKHTLPHLAEEAGFNSKTTFNRIFKNYTGQTPTDYIKSRDL